MLKRNCLAKLYWVSIVIQVRSGCFVDDCFRRISNASRLSFDNVNSFEVPHSSILHVLTRSSERSASSGDSVSWFEEAQKTFLPIVLAVGTPMVHPRVVAIVRGAGSGPLLTEVVVERSMLSVPKKLSPDCYQSREV